MGDMFKTEGMVIQEITTKDVKNLDVKNFYESKDYINYDNTYVSLTRQDYGESKIDFLIDGRTVGQIVAGFIDGYVLNTSGLTIHENFKYQNDHTSKGKSINNFNERSDYHVFFLPTYTIDGATKIMTGVTSASTGVYIVDTLSSLTFTTIFNDTSGYTTSFFVNNNGIKFELFQRTTPSTIFASPYPAPAPPIIGFVVNPIFNQNIIDSTDYFTKVNLENYVTSYSSVTYTFDLTNFEGEFVIKGLFKWTNFSYFSNLIGSEYYQNKITGIYPNNLYNIYDPDKDYYFIYLKKAEKPKITSNIFTQTNLPLNVISLAPCFDGQVDYPIANDINTVTSSILVTVNGIVLSTDEYIYSSNTLSIISGYLKMDDIITLAYSNQINTPPIQTESYKITSIPNTTYPNYGQKVIYNTSKNKYEYWLDYESVGDLVLSVNGQILPNNIDFYVSSSNKKRIIFENVLNIDDIITVFYNSVLNNGNKITSSVYNLNWSLNEAPKNNSGYFQVQVANYSDTTFSSPIFTGITLYNQNIVNYNMNISFSGNYGDKFLVRVINYKNYYTILNELIQTINYSEIVPLTISTNALNNY
jgi:hypothetical protein